MISPSATARVLAIVALVLLASSSARGEDAPDERSPLDIDQPRSVARERSTDPDVQEAGFGQDEDELPRNLRVRLELSGMLAAWDADIRIGKEGLSNRIHLQEDLDFSRFAPAWRAAAVVKLHRYIAVGYEYWRLTAESNTTVARRDLRFGPFPTEIPPGARVASAVELQQHMMTLRFVAADDNEIRAEFALGVEYVRFRLGLHPKPPIPLYDGDRLRGGGVFIGTSRTNDAWFAPTLSTFFAWNFHPRVAIYIDTTSGYVSFNPTFGSIASLNRGGFRFKIWQGLEVAVGVWLASGQTYDIRDRLSPFVGSSHVFRQSSWIAGGPDLTIAFTY